MPENSTITVIVKDYEKISSVEVRKIMEDKIIGILGGMGPLATADLFRKIVELTDAGTDEEHIHIIIDSNASIPDRTRAILYGGDNPVPAMVKSAKFLEDSGAGLIVMPCNTAHYFIEEVQKEIHIPIINMIACTAQAAKDLSLHTVGLLATDGTCQSGIYHRTLNALQIRTVTPDNEQQKIIMDIIYKGVKGNDQSHIRYCDLKEILQDMENRGAQAFLLGCTELPLVCDNSWSDKLFLNPTRILAQNAITSAGKKVRKVK